MNHHRIDFRKLLVAFVGVLMVAAPLAGFLPDAQAQIAPPEVCGPAGEQIDAFEQLIDDNEPEDPSNAEEAVFDFLRNAHGHLTTVYGAACGDEPPPTTPGTPSAVCEPVGEQIDAFEEFIDDNEPEDPSNAEEAVFDFLRNAHGHLTTAHGILCPPEDDDTTTTSSTTTTVPPSTTTTVPAIRKPRVSSNDGLVREIGRLEYEPRESGSNRGRAAVVLDPARGWGFRIYAGLGTTSEPRIHRFDLEKLTEGRSETYDFSLNSPASGNNSNTGTDLVTAVGGGKLFVTDSVNRVHVIDGATLVREGSLAPPLPQNPLSAGLDSVGDTLDSALHERTPVMPQSNIKAMTYLAPHGEVSAPKLLVYIAAPHPPAGSMPGGNFLAQWDLASGDEDWAVRLGACPSREARNRRYAPSVAVSVPPRDPAARDVMLGCYTSSGRAEVWNLRLAPDGSGIANEEQIAIIPAASGFLPDPAGRRMSVYLDTGAGQFIVGVDLERRGVYGAALLTPESSGTTAGVGIDSGSGRIYSFASATTAGDGDGGGLLLVDGRRQPLPQRFAYGELNPIDQNGGDRIAVAPATKQRPARIFVPLAGDDAMIRVYEDRRPVVGNTPLSEADRFTQDIDEEEGKTRVSTTGTTSAYGVRVWLTGGLYHLFPPETVIHDTVLGNNVRPACQPHNRELVLAEVSPAGKGTTLSNSGVNAAAVAARVDERTRQDLGRPAAACWPSEGFFSNYNGLANALNNLAEAGIGPANEVYDEVKDTDIPIGTSDPDDDGPTLGELLGLEEIPERPVPVWPDQPDPTIDQEWRETVPDQFPFYPAICSQPGQKSTRPLPEDHEDHGEDDFIVNVLGARNLGPAPGFSALAACGEDGRSVVSHATAADTLGLNGVLTFDGAETTSTLTWKEDGGIEVVTIARAKGVSVGGVLRIGEVRTTAVSKAAGRPGTAGTSVTREWCGVVGLGSQSGQQACQNVDDPEFQDRLEQLNTNVLSRRGIELRATPIDPELRQGTPGGALAAVQKDRFLVAGESFLNNDERSNVAGLELIEVTDTGANRSRHIYQLAGVEASTSYNISPIPQFDFEPFGLPTFDGPGGLPPSASEVLAASGDQRTPQRVVGAEPAGTSAAAAPPVGGGLLEALGGGLRWLLRNPLETLKFMALLATAWALPLHLHEKRRMLLTATLPGGK